MAVGDDLDLDVAAPAHVALAEHRAVAERRRRPRARRRRGHAASSSGRSTTRMPRPPPPADALTRSGYPISAGSSTTVESGSTGRPAARIAALASIFDPIAAIASGGGPIHTRPALIDQGGEVGGLGEEAVAGMDGVGAGAPGGLDEQVVAEVRVGGRGARQSHGRVAGAHVQRAGIGVAEDRDRADPEPATGTGDAAGDLAAVGDERRSMITVASHPEHAVAVATRRRRCCAPPTGRSRGPCGCRAGR